MKEKVKETRELKIEGITVGSVRINLVGTSSYIPHRLSSSARQELLWPSKEKKKSGKPKHNMLEEYRESFYLSPTSDYPTLLVIPSCQIKASMREAGLELPETNKRQVGRLVKVAGEINPLYGIPYMWTETIIQLGMSHAPDIRTRPILPKWATVVNVTYVQPQFTAQAVHNLLAVAGQIMGVGDFRPQKGAGSCGCFRIASDNDPELLEIMKMGYKEQKEAYDSPQMYNRQTEKDYTFFVAEAARRGIEL